MKLNKWYEMPDDTRVEKAKKLIASSEVRDYLLDKNDDTFELDCEIRGLYLNLANQVLKPKIITIEKSKSFSDVQYELFDKVIMQQKNIEKIANEYGLTVEQIRAIIKKDSEIKEDKYNEWISK